MKRSTKITHRVKVWPQSPDGIFGDVRRQLAAGCAERKDTDLLVRIVQPLGNLPVEQANSAALGALPGGQKRFDKHHLKKINTGIGIGPPIKITPPTIHFAIINRHYHHLLREFLSDIQT